MKVENEKGQTLYHIQNMNMSSDGYPFDTYVWCDHFPTQEDLEKAFELEYADGYSEEAYETVKEEWLTTSECYMVYAEEI